MYGICSSCLSISAFRSDSGLYSTGRPGPVLCRSVQSISSIGVKSKFSNNNLGEPTLITLYQMKKVDIPYKY
jgi:hypothetical protein